MARGVNKVIIVGNLGKDPETRYMPSGSAVTNLRIATTEAWKDKQTGDQQERTEWHSVRSCWSPVCLSFHASVVAMRRFVTALPLGM